MYLQTCPGDLRLAKKTILLSRDDFAAMKYNGDIAFSAVIFSSLPLWQVGLVRREAFVSLAMLFYVTFPLNFVCISPIGKMEKKIMTLSMMSLDKEQALFRPTVDRALGNRYVIFHFKRISGRIFRCM